MTRREGSSSLPLSSAQAGVWAAQKLDPNNPRFNCGGYLEILGPLDIELLERAIRVAVADTEPMRVHFAATEEIPCQVIEESVDSPLEVIDVSGKVEPLVAAESLMKRDLTSPLNLGSAPLFRHVLFRLNANNYLFYFRYHHIFMDGYGQMLYWRRLGGIYSNLAQGRPALENGSSASIADLLEEERQYRASAQYARDDNYWLDLLSDRPDPVRLSSRVARTTRGLLRRASRLEIPVIEGLREAARRAQTRWSVIVTAATAAYMHRLTGADDVILAMPVTTRLSANARNTPSMMANELPLRIDFSAPQSVERLIAQVSGQVGQVLKHQRYRGEELQRKIKSSGNDGAISGPVVNVISFDNEIAFGSSPTRAHHLSTGPVSDLLIGFYGGTDASDLQVYFDANPELYTAEEVEVHQSRFLRFLNEFVESDLAGAVSDIDLMLPGERDKLLTQFNDTERAYDLSACLHELVDECARGNPDRTALETAEGKLSYQELLTRSDTLATYLVGNGVQPGACVGVYDERSLGLVVKLLAVLKAGAAYVPLDPGLPRQRLEFQIRDAGIETILTSARLSEGVDNLGAVVVTEEDIPTGFQPNGESLPRTTASDPAYVLFTSGSTGQPKGVVVPHRGVVNRLLWMQEMFPLSGEDCVLQKTPFTFDVSVWEFFWPLITGARMFLAEPGQHRDPRYIARTIEERGVTTVHFVPPMLDLFLGEPQAAGLRSLKQVFCSGEALKPETVRAFFDIYPRQSVGTRLHNLYGPTEASIDVTAWECQPEHANAPIPIGFPVANTQIYILDDNREPVPVGVSGEIHIGGVQLALGYLKRPELTQNAFVPNPYGEGKLYRTGDLGCYRPDGAVEFLGRIDSQVKIRGFRIELGEIESALKSHESVEQAVVIAWENKGRERTLAGYVVSGSEPKPDSEEILAHLEGRLPEYMVPATITFLPELPLTPNGKIDRKALPKPGRMENSEALGPETEQQALLHEVWSEVLGLDSFGIDDSFFSLGGDSMLSIRIRARVEQRGYTFDVQDLFNDPTVRRLAERLTPFAGSKGEDAGTAPFELVRGEDRARLPEGLTDAYPLSAMQRGMLFQAEYDSDSAVYRVVTSLHIAGPLDEALLRRALDATFERHPALRSSFDLTSFSEPLQLVHAEVDVPLEIGEDLSELDDAAQSEFITAWIDNAKYHQFDPGRPPLVRFTVHRRGEERFELSVIEHHVVLDGWSDVIMLEEIVTRYRALLQGEDLWLAEIPSTYRDFVAEERRILANTEAKEFWRGRLEGIEPSPLPRKVVRADEAKRTTNLAVQVPLDGRVVKTVKKVANEHGLPLKSMLTAAHLMVLRTVCSSEEVSTGVVFNGRLEQEGGDEVIGVFLNTLPLRVDMGQDSLLTVASKVFREEQSARSYGRYPFGQMQQDAHGQVELDSYVNFMDFHRDWHGDGPNGNFILDTIGVAETNFALAVNFLVDPVSDELRLWLDCDVSVLDGDLCARLAGYYQRALDSVAYSHGSTAGDISLLSESERALVATWNENAVAYDKAATIHGLIDQQGARHPEATALAYRWGETSYGRMLEQANQLAHYLRKNGVSDGSLVGVCLPRSEQLVVTLLAVMKAGGAYVPLDPGYPRTRLEYIVRDAQIQCLVTDHLGSGLVCADTTVLIDGDSESIAAQPVTPVDTQVTGEDPAYVIYTSGSTGLPKGTRIRHRNVVNFFVGMDERVGCEADDVFLALTSVSFDISVLELLWPLTRGAKVVVAGERMITNLVRDEAVGKKAMTFSLFFFGAATGDEDRKKGYQLLLDAAAYADQHGFDSVWTPERHFHEFGGLYPNPSVISAALASVTNNIGLRCGSVVSPLHDSIRIAEEWSLVDNLSMGRVGLAFASGWNANDFCLAPDRYASRKEIMNAQLEEFRRLWRGGTVTRTNGNGEATEVRMFPSPVQEEPPIWFTAAGSTGTFEIAGRFGVNILTHLLGQDIDELEEKIRVYREAWKAGGHPGEGRVTLMIHTFMLEDGEEAKARARGPFREYLRTSAGLLNMLTASMGVEFPENISDEDLESLLDLAVDRYFERSGLFGSPAEMLSMVQRLEAAGINEVASLIDFGVEPADVIEGLSSINHLKALHQREVADAEHAFADLARRHRVTLVQATPSFFSAVAEEREALDSLSSARAVLVGGEAFPSGLAQKLTTALPNTRVLNMYGPTETTIWSTVHELDPAVDTQTSMISIGRPIANTTVQILDARLRPVPIGVEGELWIGGDGVSGLYIGRPDLTDERFRRPLGNELMYRTGDRVRWRPDGSIEFLGRIDRQVKILGHRIEPDEVESVLSRHPKVGSVAVVASPKANGAMELVAYVSPGSQVVDAESESEHVSSWAQVWQGAYTDPETGADAARPERDFSGWLSSYTGDPIPEEEMREWLGYTTERIASLNPASIVDVGVGVGLILRELAPRVCAYTGLDISEAALETALASLGPDPETISRVTLLQGDAGRLSELPSETGATVVINSVIQYFPGVDYLKRTLEESARVAGKDGAVFVGDVRSLELLEAFHASVQLYRAPPLTTVKEIQAAIRRQMAAERELCVSMDFFERLADEIGDRTTRIELKRGHAVNELTCFRYDVTLLSDTKNEAGAARKLDWSPSDEPSESLARVATELAGHRGSEPVILSDIPNRRLVRPIALLKLLGELDEETTAWELERLLWACDGEDAVDPEDIAELAAKAGFSVQLLMAASGRADCFDARFIRIVGTGEGLDEHDAETVAEPVE